MDEKTRQSALDKAASMSCHVAYPDELLDDNKLVEFYKGLEMSSDNYLGSILNCSFFNTQKNLNKLREPVNKNDWVSQSVHTTEEAFYMPMENNMRELFCILLPKAVSIEGKKSQNSYSQLI